MDNEESLVRLKYLTERVHDARSVEELVQSIKILVSFIGEIPYFESILEKEERNISNSEKKVDNLEKNFHKELSKILPKRHPKNQKQIRRDRMKSLSLDSRGLWLDEKESHEKRKAYSIGSIWKILKSIELYSLGREHRIQPGYIWLTLNFLNEEKFEESKKFLTKQTENILDILSNQVSSTKQKIPETLTLELDTRWDGLSGVFINGILLSKPNFGSVNDEIFQILLENPNKTFSRETLSKIIGKPITKPLSSVLTNLGFNKNIRKLFFDAGKDEICLKNVRITISDKKLIKALKEEIVEIKKKGIQTNTN